MGKETVEQLIVRTTWEWADHILAAAGEHLFTTVAVYDDLRQELAYQKGWAGGEPVLQPGEKTCAMYVGPLKVATLVLAPNWKARFAMTPVEGRMEYMGGVRNMLFDPNTHTVLHDLTSGSYWSETCDLQHALLLNYHMREQVHLQYVAFGHTSAAVMKAAVKKDERRLGVEAVNVPVRGQDRLYLRVEAPWNTPTQVYWILHAAWTSLANPSVLWDVATPDPETLLQFLSPHPLRGLVRAVQQDDNPVGGVWQQNRDGRSFGIMVRAAANSWQPS